MKYTETLKLIWGDCWKQLLSFAAIIALTTYMDVFDFKTPRDSGFWSLDTKWIVDAWHLFKNIVLLIIVVNFIKWRKDKSLSYYSTLFFLYIAMAVLIHEIIYHQFF